MAQALTYSEKVADFLKNMLLTGRLSPGDRVNEVAVATELGVSRAPIREALHMLIAEGLVINKPQRGKFITPITPEEIRNSYFIGGVLEGAAAAQKIHEFTDEDFARMKNILDQMRQGAENNLDMDILAPLDTDFHSVIFDRINNPTLRSICRDSCLRISKFLLFRHWQYAFSPEDFYQRHERIFQALRLGNAMGIESIFREHYMESGKRLSHIIQCDLLPVNKVN